ncbi:hypothetical protein CHS0354_009064 [Potamilus streckersoni]|uniref:Uncharacterized protein n=1 Tax=Potamilus streckersoni TaxID=2493646 RepID=A0AAE0WEG4_9BIVA|nr:hypothetical protein CHS0354_009064 [Potamilus streckersoni]
MPLVLEIQNNLYRLPKTYWSSNQVSRRIGAPTKYPDVLELQPSIQTYWSSNQVSRRIGAPTKNPDFLQEKDNPNIQRTSIPIAQDSLLNDIHVVYSSPFKT